MTSEDKKFQDISRDVAKRFIQTVVMVDDQAFRSREQERPEPVREPPNPLGLSELPEAQSELPEAQSELPEAQSELPEAQSELPEAQSTSGTSQNSSDYELTGNDEDLEAKELIHLFASKGLVCSVIEPNERGDPSASEAVNVAQRADVLVLDWQIRKDEGETAKKILRSVLQEDAKKGGRLRLVAFYTGSLNFGVISENLNEIMKEAKLEVSRDEEQLALTGNKHVRVVVLAKRDNQILSQFKVNHVTTEQLPERLVMEFSRLTAGLISNVALEGFSVLRDATHAVLANLHVGLDPAYVTHRALQKRPDDAIDHAIDLVASEITALLHGFEVGNVSNFEAVAAWLKPRDLRSLELGKKKPLACTPEDVERLLKDGFDMWKKSGVGSQAGDAESVSKHLTSVFANSSHGESADAKFAVATSTTRRYSEKQPAPRLTLGAILQEQDPGTGATRYWVCLQPRCDSVRIPREGRVFLFVPAEVAKTNNFDLVLEMYGEQVRLVINEKPYGLRPILFAPKEGEDVIRSTKMCDHYVFEQADTARKYVWIAQLKESHAQRVLNRFTAKFARVGLNESEWLRLGSGRKE